MQGPIQYHAKLHFKRNVSSSKAIIKTKKFGSRDQSGCGCLDSGRKS
jgi:hypothetical protein